MIKFKTCEIMQYFEFYDTQDLTIIEDRIKSLTNIKKYAFIVHDSDILENGTPKKPHFHIVCTFSNMTTSQVVSKTLKVDEQYVNKIRSTTKSALLYLVHRNHPNKFQYNAESVVSNFDYVDYVDGVSPKTDINDIAFKIDNGTIKPYNIFDFVTIQDYALHKTYFDRCFEYRQNKLRSIDRTMDCIFITGASGTGKTTLAKKLAEDKKYHIYISSGGKNPLDNYKGEECILLDDLRDTTYSLTDFLKLTDNNTNSLVGCRFYNKSIAECKLLIVTSVKPIEDFYKVVSENEKEPQQQLFRRFQTYLKMSQDTIDFYEYNDKQKQYNHLMKTNNVVSYLYNQQKALKVANDIAKTLGLQIIDNTVLQQIENNTELKQQLDNLFLSDSNKSN